MNLLDIILGAILIFAFLKGIKKGLLVTLASLIGLVLGIIGAIYFSVYAASYINEWFNWSEQTSNIVSKIVTFIGVVLLVNWMGKLLSKMADFAFLGTFNKVLGGVFNLIIFAFIISVIFMFFNQWNTSDYIIPEDKKNNSYLYKPVVALAPMVLPNLIKQADSFDFSEDILDKFEKNEKENNLEIKEEITDSIQLKEQ